MANVVTLGLSEILVGAIAGDGGMGTSLASLGYTYQDSCTMTTEDPTVTEHYAEEVEDPIYQSTKRGKTTFNFSLASPDPAQLGAVLGGTVTGSGSTAKWEQPDSMPSIQKSIKIIPSVGLVISIPRGSIVGKINATYSKTGIFLVDVSVTVLKPTKAGTASIIATTLEAEE